MEKVNAADKWLLKNGYDLNGELMQTSAKAKTKKKKPNYGHRRLKERQDKSKGLVAARKTVERSPTEKKIEYFLMKNNIRFVAEYSTNYCYSRKTNHLLFFDFWLPDHNAVIEFDGIHHFKAIYGDEMLKQQKYKDRVKNRYCEKKGIHMLRISCFVGRDFEMIICKFFDKHSL